MALTFKEYKERVSRLNGANVIRVNEKGEILNFQSKYGNKKRMLPGGKLERNELPQHAVQSETEEETGEYPTNQSLQVIGLFLQRVPGITDVRGFNVLFFSNEALGTLAPSEESEMPEFWLPEKIIAQRKEFDTSYVRMVAYYLKWKEDTIVRSARLSEPISILFEGKLIEI